MTIEIPDVALPPMPVELVEGWTGETVQQGGPHDPWLRIVNRFTAYDVRPDGTCAMKIQRSVVARGVVNEIDCEISFVQP